MPYGPFENASVNIYCDESRHEGQSNQDFMVIGGLWIPREARREILEGLHEIQRLNRIKGELKWTKLSRSRLSGYKALIDYLADRDDVHFRCIVVDKTQVDNETYFQNDKQLGFWVFYWHCLKQWMGNGNTYYISVDFKPESLHSGPRRLKQVLDNECSGRCTLKSLDCVDSGENLFCQLADILIGAVGYEQNELHASNVKLAICKHISEKYGRANLMEGDYPRTLKFNIFKIWS